MEPPIGKFVARYGLTHSPDCKFGLTYTPDYKSGGTEIIRLQIRWNWIWWNWGWETISWNAMNHHLRRKSFKTCASSFETWWIIWDVINHVSTLFICLLYLFRHRSIYSFLIEVYLHLSSKYIFFRHRSITPIAEMALPRSKINCSVP